MIRSIGVTLCVALSCLGSSAVSADTTSYTYDALGRLRRIQQSDGPAGPVQLEYQYDASGNRTQYIVSGSSSSGTLTITPFGGGVYQSATGVTLGVNVSGSNAPTGTVSFTENGVFLGSTFVQNGQASIILEGFSVGTHTITVSYSGDTYNAPYSYTFVIKVYDLKWLPAVLEILLSD